QTPAQSAPFTRRHGLSRCLVERIHASLKRTCPNGHPGSNPGTATNPPHVPVRLLAPHGLSAQGRKRPAPQSRGAGHRLLGMSVPRPRSRSSYLRGGAFPILPTEDL